MRKYLILAAALALLVAPGTARAVTTLTTTCATTTLQYWTANVTHDGHNIQQQIQPHGESDFGAYYTIAQVGGEGHVHTYYAARPQAQKARFRVQTTNGGTLVESDEDVVCDLSSTIHFAAGAEYGDCYVSDLWPVTGVENCGVGSSCSGSGTCDNGEWAKHEYELGGFGAGVETGNPSPLKDVGSYVCSAQTFTDDGDGDRCEYATGNASASNISTNAI